MPLDYIVEYYGSKGWEICYEGQSAETAAKYFREYIADGCKCRITVPANCDYFGSRD